jgi:NADH-quinone oxidoreductase subunit L
VITGVGLLIHIYSTGYMHDDADYARYFTYLNLFVGAMLILVMADNYVLMFVGWEGVGLCSYLLIGFWYTRQSATEAGKKAFIVNRIGDFGFLLAVLLLFMTFQTADMLRVQEQLTQAQVEVGVLTAIALLLFMGAVV